MVGLFLSLEMKVQI